MKRRSWTCPETRRRSANRLECSETYGTLSRACAEAVEGAWIISKPDALPKPAAAREDTREEVVEPRGADLARRAVVTALAEVAVVGAAAAICDAPPPRPAASRPTDLDRAEAERGALSRPLSEARPVLAEGGADVDEP